MTSQGQTAVLVDLHPSSSSSSPFIPNHTDLQEINGVLLHSQESCDLIQLYILTSSATDVSGAVDKLTSSEGPTRVTVVEADDRIASFYSAKQQLDNLDITQVKLVCHALHEKFWTCVCRFLFTPVHEWQVEAVDSPSGNEDFPTRKTNTTVENHKGVENHVGTSSETTSSVGRETDSSSGPQDDVTAESVRTQIRRFLRTLPSFLAPPEVDMSRKLPGEGAGFVHGYSTRRGGVTTLATQCSMNLMYTDKKRDSQLVVEENRRRLSLVGGFEPRNFHIVKVEHGIRVWTVGEEDQPPKYDALVTNRPDVTIAAAGADCIPLLFADPVAKVIGAAHAGWMGTANRVAECVVTTMAERFGSRPEDIWVSMGPGLRLGCFKVLQEEGKIFADVHPSCQADSVDPVAHRIDQTSLNGGGLSGWKDLGKSPLHDNLQVGKVLHMKRRGQSSLCDDLQLHQKQTAPLIENLNVADFLEEKTDETSIQTSGTSEESGKMTSVHINTQDKDHMSDTTSVRSGSNQPLADLRVELIPTDQLKPKTPKTRRSSRLQLTFVDLQMTNYHVLLQAGVKPEHIDMSTSHCTKCNPDLYFSFERDGFPFGNQIGFICMPSSELD